MIVKKHRLALLVAIAAALASLLTSISARADVAFPLYVADTTNNAIQEFTSGAVGSVFATGIQNPRGLAFDSAGNLYAANFANPGTIRKFSPTGTDLGVFANTDFGPEGLAFDSAGNLYAANANSNTIQKFTPGGVGSLFAPTSFGPYGLAFDGAGNLYAAIDNNTIEKFTPGGVGSVFANSALNGPRGLAFDGAGNLYAANFFGNTIEKFTPGGVGSLFANSGLSGPFGLAFDSAGNLYAANNNDGRIERFTPGGVGSLFVSNTFQPSFLAFQFESVPEPGTLALLAVGGVMMVASRHGRHPAPAVYLSGESWDKQPHDGRGLEFVAIPTLPAATKFRFVRRGLR